MVGAQGVRIGAIDIGTNSVRLLVAERVGNKLKELVRQSTVTRLGQGVDDSGILLPDAIARTIAVLNTYGAIMDDHGVEARRAIATSASRDATNVETFMEEAAAAIGVRPDVVGGDEEARLSFRGATWGPTAPRNVPGSTLVIDVGGGSSEFVAGTNEPLYARSVDIGSVRLTERHLGSNPSSPVAVDEARAHTAALFRSQLRLPDIAVALGVAGTYTTVAAMHLELAFYDRSAVDGTVLTLADLRDIVERLAVMSLQQIMEIPSMDPARAPVILGGTIVAEQALAASQLGEITVSESDILHGVALSLVG